MNQHAEVEELSALVDGELSGPDHARLQGHLVVCETCTAVLQDLQRTSFRIAALPPVTPDHNQTRALRQAVLAEFAPPARSARRFLPLVGVGGMAMVLLAVIAFSTMRNEVTSGVGADRELRAASFAFTDPEQVRNTVLELPEVEQGIERFSVADVGERQSEMAVEVGAEAPQHGIPAPAELKEADRTADKQMAASAPVADTAFPEGSAEVCVRRVLAAQPYPALPIYAGRATFKTKPAWLIVYVWSPSNSDKAKLDQVQAWLVAPSDCTTLHYQSFRRTKSPAS